MAIFRALIELERWEDERNGMLKRPWIRSPLIWNLGLHKIRNC